MSYLTVYSEITDEVYDVEFHDRNFILKSTNVKNEVEIPLKYLSNIPNFVRYHIINRDVAPFVKIDDIDIYKTLPGTSNHIFMEISNGITLTNAIKILPLDDIYSIVLQVLMALSEAYLTDNSCFEHGDLHCDNIMIKRLPNTMSINYPNISTKINVKYLAEIIDYGYCMTHDMPNSETVSINDICELYGSIITILNSVGREYKNTPFYTYLVDVMKTLDMEEDFGPIEQWKPAYFNLYPAESGTRIPMTIDMLIHEINNITSYVDINEMFYNKDTMPYVREHIAIDNLTIDDENPSYINTIDNLKELGSLYSTSFITNTIGIMGSTHRSYWNEYARIIANILLLTNAKIDKYIVNATQILIILKRYYRIDRRYRLFFSDTLGI